MALTLLSAYFDNLQRVPTSSKPVKTILTLFYMVQESSVFPSLRLPWDFGGKRQDASHHAITVLTTTAYRK